MIYKIVDGIEIGTKLVDGKEVQLTPEEEAYFVQRAKEHIQELESYEIVKYRDERLSAYNERGADIQSVVEALRENLAESRPEKLQAIQEIVDQVKIEFPKPEVTSG